MLGFLLSRYLGIHGVLSALANEMNHPYHSIFFTATVPLVGLQCVIVVFPDHTHFSAGTLLRRNDVASTLIRRCFKVVCPLGYLKVMLR